VVFYPKPDCFCRCRQLPGIWEWQPPLLEFPAIDPANATERDEFRLNIFPPANGAMSSASRWRGKIEI
jgi:hypothetical protein